MKSTFLASLLLTGLASFATGRDSTFHRHEFSVNMTNGLSMEFFDRAGNGTTNKAQDNGNGTVSELPMYAMHLRGYSLIICRRASVRNCPVSSVLPASQLCV